MWPPRPAGDTAERSHYPNLARRTQYVSGDQFSTRHFLGSHSEYLVDVQGIRLRTHSMLDLSIGARCFIMISRKQAACYER